MNTGKPAILKKKHGSLRYFPRGCWLVRVFYAPVHPSKMRSRYASSSRQAAHRRRRHSYCVQQVGLVQAAADSGGPTNENDNELGGPRTRGRLEDCRQPRSNVSWFVGFESVRYWVLVIPVRLFTAVLVYTVCARVVESLTISSLSVSTYG